MTEYSLLPDEFNFTFWQGDTVNIEFQVVNTALVPVDLTTYTIKSQLRDTTGLFIGELKIVQVDFPGGIFETFLDHATSSSLVPGQVYKYDVQLTGSKTIDLQPYDTVVTIISGNYIARQEYTLDTPTQYVAIAPGEKPSYRISRGL